MKQASPVHPGYAIILGIAMMLVVGGAYIFCANLMRAEPVNQKLAAGFFLGLIILAVDLFVLGGRSFPNRLVSAGIMVGASLMAYSAVQLIFGADKLGRQTSTPEIIERFVVGLILLLIFRLLKKYVLEKTPTNQVTLRDDPHGQN